MSHVVLYTDAGGPVDGRMLLGVCGVDGVLLQWDRVQPREGRNRDNVHCEYLAVLMAARYAGKRFCIGGQPGVILTDSRGIVEALARDPRELPEGREPRGFVRSDHKQLAVQIAAALPRHWFVAWIPRARNIANAALRRMPDDPVRKLDG